MTEKRIKEIFEESIQVKRSALAENSRAIFLAAQVILQALRKGGKILFFGNGGSAADSQHIAAEFIGRFKKERRSLPAIALTTDSSILTAVGNDYGFEKIFSRQLEGLAHKHDVAFGISTSGNSKNVLEAIQTAKKLGLKTIGLSGSGGGRLGKMVDVSIAVSSTITARVQESHILIAHVICELVEDNF